jgi:serralysin
VLGGGANHTRAGGAGHDQLKGGIGNDTLYGGAGDDQLVGDTGNDKMIGGAGDDVYLVDSTGDKVTERAGEGQDTVIALVANYTLGANVENLGFFGAVGNAVGKGNTLDNIIIGAAGDDKLDGAAGSDQLAGDKGNDKLTGGAGDDVLEGGLGFDTLDGGAGSDVFLYALDNPGDLAGLGGDVISSFEHGKDIIDVRDLFDDFGINTANPFASGHLIIDNTGVNAVLSFDPDGGGFGAAPVTLAIVGHIDLQASDVAF